MDQNQVRKLLREEMRERTVGYIVAAFGIVAGLAWNDAIKALIEAVYPMNGGGALLSRFIYAILVTILVVVVTSYLMRLSKKE